MSFSAVRSPARYSPDIRRLRERVPGVNYDAHCISRDGPSATRAARWTTLKQAYGSRHMYDIAEFSLWSDEKQDFRRPEHLEMQWILQAYQAVDVLLIWPEIHIITETAPNPLPLTVGCVAARFLPANWVEKSDFSRVNTSYANPRLPNPVSFILPRWTSPNDEQKRSILLGLLNLANVKAVTWLGPSCYVELHTGDDRTYGRHSLPGMVGGKRTTYHHSDVDLWVNDMGDLARARAIDPGAVTTGPRLQDRTNYLEVGAGVLQPGVRLAGSLNLRSGQFANVEQSTSAGVRLRKNRGKVVMTAANHGFLETDEVYHPSVLHGSKVGDIVERWLAQDIAMVQLIPSVGVKNEEYFEATAPRRLLRASEAATGGWCSVDGMSTGLVFLQRTGERAVQIHLQEAAPGIANHTVEYEGEMLFSTFGPNGGAAAAGVCGAPIVEEDDPEQEWFGGGGVCGFYRQGNAFMAITPALDDLINSGWEIF
ncbi:MAG: hypothetical protein M4579_002112 [Chaenotheca gracillima]|nr:MAG: hypothetical protein M4579_002112 [Chaenotheca gracillima]